MGNRKQGRQAGEVLTSDMKPRERTAAKTKQRRSRPGRAGQKREEAIGRRKNRGEGNKSICESHFAVLLISQFQFSAANKHLSLDSFLPHHARRSESSRPRVPVATALSPCSCFLCSSQGFLSYGQPRLSFHTLGPHAFTLSFFLRSRAGPWA